MATRPHKRRRILIDPPFQYRLLLINILYFCVILLVFLGALFLPLIFQLDSETLTMMEQGEVAREFLSLHARVWPAIFVAFVLLAIHSLFVSHRIAGPLFRFRSTFKAVAGGDLSVRANLRKRDYLGKESEVLNEMIASLQARIKGLEDHYTQMWAVASALQESIDSGSAEDMKQNAEHLRIQMEQFKMSVEQFRTEPDQKGGKEGHTTPVAPPSPSEDSAPLTRS